MFEDFSVPASGAVACPTGLPEAEMLAALDGAPGPELAELLAATDPAECRDDVVVAEIQAWERLAAWVAAGQSRAIAKLARLRPHPGTQVDGLTPLEGQVSPYLEDELALALRQSRFAASERLALALQLDELPATADALAAGQIDVAKARAVCSATALLPRDVAAGVEALVLPDAPAQTAPQLRAALRKAILEADPQRAEQRHAKAVSDRKVRVYPGEDGMATLWALLPAPEAVALYGHLTQLARRFPRPAGEHPSWPQTEEDASAQLSDLDSASDGLDPHGRTLDQRRADALVYLGAAARHLTPSNGIGASEAAAVSEAAASESATLESAASESATLESAASKNAGRKDAGCECAVAASSPRVPLTAVISADVQIVIAGATLLGLDDKPAELGGYGPIPAGLGRRLAGDGTWRRILMDPVDGELLEVSRKAYRPSPVLDDLVRTRDGTCRFEGCRQPARRCDLDHTVAHADGGPTTPGNLGALCRHHHRLKTHAPGWTVAQDERHAFVWTTPTGRTHITQPAIGRPPARESSAGVPRVGGRGPTGVPGHEPPEEQPA